MKRESIEEFLARGGQIQKCEAQATPEEASMTMPKPTGNATMMSLSEGSLFYSEKKIAKERKKKKVALEALNINALPASLRRFLPQQN